MKLKRFLGISALVFMLVLTGCGKSKKSETESADKRLEKTFKAYSMEKVADESSDVEAVENVTIIGNFNVKTSEMSLNSNVEFKVDLKDQKFYVGGFVKVDSDKIAFDVYGESDKNNNGTIYVKADEFLEDWLAITFTGDEMGEVTGEDIDVTEMLKIDFSAFKDIKEIETKDGITKISAKMDLADAYEDEIENSGMDVEIPEITIYFYIDEDDRLTKIEFDTEDLLKSDMFAEMEMDIEELEISLEFKDYGKTTIDVPEDAKNTENIVTAEDLITSILTLFLGDMDFEDTDFDYDFDTDYDLDFNFDSEDLNVVNN